MYIIYIIDATVRLLMLSDRVYKKLFEAQYQL